MSTTMKTARNMFVLGQTVNVGAGYSEKIGTIVGFNDDFPFHAEVRLDHQNGSTICMIKVKHLSGYTRTAKDKFSVGQFVQVSGYSEKYGKIVGFLDSFPYHANVCLNHMNGGYTTCMIKMEHIS